MAAVRGDITIIAEIAVVIEKKVTIVEEAAAAVDAIDKIQWVEATTTNGRAEAVVNPSTPGLCAFPLL
ncbi:hypothetical protein [Ureibacillus aquaedulcis]|uniref:Uncharacterized protein n=1 Tax=Ureibacillus aquaedulcis TaxID=3058421 RepID=A0ABT8GV03_9BACL|nr:hypothetical protein [Ureibacillus sp. BA0131]MDN4495242.1 hypothetical protein [Ureibacillus sp. BA0131]